MPELRGGRWAQLAAEDLERGFEFLWEKSPTAAHELVAGVRDVIASLREHPRMGPVVGELQPHGVYRSVLVGRSHRVFYRIDDEHIWVVRIWDTRRDPQELKLVE